MHFTTFSACCSNTNTCTQHELVMATASHIQSRYQHITTMIFVLLRWKTGSLRIRSWGTCCDSMALWDHPAQIPSENVAVHDVYENKHIWAKKVLELLWDTLFVVKCAWSKGRVMEYFPLFFSQCLSSFLKIHTLHLVTATQNSNLKRGKYPHQLSSYFSPHLMLSSANTTSSPVSSKALFP